MNPWLGIGLIWLLCSIWVYGRHLAYWQNEYPLARESSDWILSFLFSLFGPLGLITLLEIKNYGLQFLPEPSDCSMISPLWADAPRKRCPDCGVKSHVERIEVLQDRWLCLHCRQYFRLSTGERIRADLGDDEPDWSEPDEAEMSYARATMPSRASGHVIAWRSWNIHDAQMIGSIDHAKLEDLVTMSDDELLDVFAQYHREIQAARNKPRYLLESGNGHVWQPDQPMVGYHVEHMPRAHGAGIYALRNCPNSGQAYGRVALWGNVVEHDNGYRARYAYPVELWTRQQHIADALSQAYGVPCHVDSDMVPEVDYGRAMTATQILQQMSRIRGHSPPIVGLAQQQHAAQIMRSYLRHTNP